MENKEIEERLKKIEKEVFKEEEYSNSKLWLMLFLLLLALGLLIGVIHEVNEMVKVWFF